MGSRIEDILRATIDGAPYNELAQSRIEALLIELKEAIEAGGGTDPDAVHSDDVSTIRIMTQAAYDALTVKDVDTIYFLT